MCCMYSSYNVDLKISHAAFFVFGVGIFINVQTPTRTITLQVKEIDTVQRVKAKLNKDKFYTIDQEVLVFKGQPLKCMHKLSDYAIKNQSTIHTQPGY